MRRGLTALVTLYAGEGIARIIAFSLTAVLARVIGLEGFANLLLAQSVITWVTVFSDAGLNNHSARLLAEGKRPRVAVVWLTLNAQVIFAVCGIILVVPLVALTIPSLAPYMLVLSAVPLANALSVSYILQAEGRFAGLTVSRIISSVVTLAFGLLVVWLAPGRGWLTAVAYSAGAVALAGFLAWRTGVNPLRAIVPISFRRPLGYGFKNVNLAIYAVLLQVLHTLPLILAKFYDPSQYEAMGVVIRIWFIVTIPAAMVGTYVITRVAEDGGVSRPLARIFALYQVSSVVIAGVVVLGSEPILQIVYGPSAAEYHQSLTIFACAIPAYFASMFAVAVITGQGKYWPTAVWAASACLLFLASFWTATASGSGQSASISWLACQWISAALVLVLTLRGRVVPPNDLTR